MKPGCLVKDQEGVPWRLMSLTPNGEAAIASLSLEMPERPGIRVHSQMLKVPIHELTEVEAAVQFDLLGGGTWTAPRFREIQPA